MQGRLKWLICAALAATVVFSLMTYFDPVSLWFHHKVKETEIQLTRAKTVDNEHQPATQNSSTIQGIDWDVGQGFRRSMQGRLKWLICAALAATVVFSLMTYFDPVSLWFHHKVKETEIQLTRAKTVDNEHQPATQNSSTIQGIDWDVGVQRLDPIVYSEPCSGTINDSRCTTLFKDYDKVQYYLDDNGKRPHFPYRLKKEINSQMA